MTKVNLYSAKGLKIGTTILPKLFDGKVNLKLLAQAVRVYSDNFHFGHSKVKTRSEVDRTKKKWYRQKGTGGARHGAKSAPIFVGGGVAHGPKLVRKKLELPGNLRKGALCSALCLKANEEKILAIRGLSQILKTKEAQTLINKLNLGKLRTTFVLDKVDKNTPKAFRNLENSRVLFYKNLNVYDVYFGGILMLEEKIFGLKSQNVEKAKKLTKKK